MGYLFGLLVDGAIIGIIIAVMQQGEFPGWGPCIGCVLAIGITAAGVSMLVPDGLWFLSPLAGAAMGALMINWLFFMGWPRSFKAAGIYFGIKFVFALAVYALLG